MDHGLRESNLQADLGIKLKDFNAEGAETQSAQRKSLGFLLGLNNSVKGIFHLMK